MLTLVVTARTTSSPTARGRQVVRGFKLKLEPERFQHHAVLAKKLLSSRSWVEFKPKLVAQEGESKKVETPRDTMLPHQRAALRSLQERGFGDNG